MGGISLLTLSSAKDNNYFTFSFLMSFQVFAQEISDSSDGDAKLQNDSQIVKASGHFANNQIKDGIVTWIQGGFWNLDIKNVEGKGMQTVNMTAIFNANFTMIRPDGSLSHNHIIDNFISNNVIFTGNDIVITGVSDILSNNGIEYRQVPITVHLMGKKVLGLMIDVNKTGGHFLGSNEMFGTLISGIGLNGLDTNNNISKINYEVQIKKDNLSTTKSMTHAMH